MKKLINNFLAEYEKSNRKRFDIQILEQYLIEKYKGYGSYIENGGYIKLHHIISQLKENKCIKEVKSSAYNGLNPPLKTRWQIIAEEEVQRWSTHKILQFSDLLDFTYYKNHPKLQNDLEWEYIENIYSFLKFREEREWVSIEERSLELFYDEKFLTERKETLKGKYGILKRLGLSYKDLKMKKYGEMFIYWNKGVEKIKRIIILENHSTFFTYKRIAEEKGKIFDFEPDILIYGEGKKIEKSLSFLEEIADVSKVEVLYFGDIDTEGFGIYYRLKERYPEINIKLQYGAYDHLISICDRYYPLGSQKKEEIYLTSFIEEIEDHIDARSVDKLKYIWEKDSRIPQELITYEYLLKVTQ